MMMMMIIIIMIIGKFIRNAIHNMHSGEAICNKCFAKCIRNVMFVSLCKRLVSNYNSQHMHIKELKVLRNIKFPHVLTAGAPYSVNPKYKVLQVGTQQCLNCFNTVLKYLNYTVCSLQNGSQVTLQTVRGRLKENLKSQLL